MLYVMFHVSSQEQFHLVMNKVITYCNHKIKTDFIGKVYDLVFINSIYDLKETVVQLVSQKLYKKMRKLYNGLIVFIMMRIIYVETFAVCEL